MKSNIDFKIQKLPNLKKKFSPKNSLARQSVVFESILAPPFLTGQISIFHRKSVYFENLIIL